MRSTIFCVFVCCVLVIFGACAFEALEARAESRCLARGFPSATLTAGLTTYCVKRVNQTDIVERLP